MRIFIGAGILALMSSAFLTIIIKIDSSETIFYQSYKILLTLAPIIVWIIGSIIERHLEARKKQ